MKYWIGVAARDHVRIGIEGGFAQLGHGKHAPVKRLGRGDGLVYYSARTGYRDGETVQAFTAIGRVIDDTPYQVEMGEGFSPYRRDLRYFPHRDAPIRPLIEKLEFIPDKSNWGVRFRYGLLSVSENDFRCIAEAMLVSDGLAAFTSAP